MLEVALVTDLELEVGQSGWDLFTDPFAEWKTKEELAAAGAPLHKEEHVHAHS
jgi:hypothetical protein